MHIQSLQSLRQLIGYKQAAFPPRGKCGLLLIQGRPHSASPGRTHLKNLGQRKNQITLDERKIHSAVVSAMNELFNAQAAKQALTNCITAVLAGEMDELTLPAVDAQIQQMQERQMELLQLAVGAGPDCVDYDEEIQRVSAAKTQLMAKKAELEREQRTAGEFDLRMDQIAALLNEADCSITDFDEVTVRQIVSNIKVMDKDRLLIRFKDGTEIEQAM